MENPAWTPDHAGPCLLVCERGDGTQMAVATYDTPEQAREADAALYDRPCGPGCLRLHYRVWAEPGRLHVEKGLHDPAPVPPTLARQLAKFYPRHTRNGHPLKSIELHPELWPCPPEFNQPLPPRSRPL